MPLQRNILFRNDLLSARFVACRKAHREISQEEFSDSNVVIFPIRGVFVEHFTKKHSVLADPTTALVFPAGSSSRISHPVDLGDDCFVLEFSSSCFQDVAYADGCVEDWRTPAHCVLASHELACRCLMLYRLQHKIANDLEVEENSLILLNSILRKIGNKKKQKLVIKSWPQIEEVKIAFSANPEVNWSLTALSRLVKTSPFHLTRLFRESTGLPLHRYLLFSRIARAMDSLLNTNRDVTEIAMELSFSTPSHFTSAFRRMIGVTPTAFRSSATSKNVNEAYKILKKEFPDS